jgi:hypothetical protein
VLRMASAKVHLRDHQNDNATSVVPGKPEEQKVVAVKPQLRMLREQERSVVQLLEMEVEAWSWRWGWTGWG